MYNTRVRDAWECLSVLQREILSADLAGDDEIDDEEIATRFGTTAAAVRVERILARRRLNDARSGPSCRSGERVMAKANGSTPKAAAPKAVAVARAPQSPLRKVSISARLDGVREVLVTGDFTQWKGAAVPLTPTADGTWTATLQLAPGEYQYRLLVDGQWRDHAEAPRRVPNPYGTENCVLTVG